MKRLPLVIILTLVVGTFMNAQEEPVSFFVTTGEQIRVQHSELVKLTSSEDMDFSIDLESKKQVMHGFGGAFNEQGWVALSALEPAAREEVLKNIFSPSEANLTWGRIPIGASDYAIRRYTLAGTPDDFEMKSFSIAHDENDLIPYIKAAQVWQPKLKLWASAWSPTIWMKDNNEYEGGKFIDKAEYYKAYALYLSRFVQAYTAKGMPIVGVAVQNEPTVVTGYPNGGWTPEQFRKFIRDFGGPLFASLQLEAKLWLGTFNEGSYTFARTVIADPEALKYVGAVGLQWGGDQQIPAIRQDALGLPIIQTETDCGNWHWMPGFQRRRPPNDFKYAAFTWGRMRDYLSAGAEAYMLWNIVLYQNGMNIDKNLRWPQNSGIVVDKTTKKVTYTPMFRAFEHFSRYVPDGSVLLGNTGGARDVIAFQDPSGAVVVELMNKDKENLVLTGEIGGKTYSVELPPESFATLIVK